MNRLQTYTIHFWKTKGDIRYPNFYGMRDEELQKRINEKMEEVLHQEILLLLENEGIIWGGAQGNILSASQEEVHLQYDMLYDYEGVERGYSKRIYRCKSFEWRC